MAKVKQETTEEANKLAKLKEAMEKKYGKGVMVSGNTKGNFSVVSTGSLKFDKITDCGGIPLGKLVEMHGPESSGKSTLALHIIAEFQKQGKVCLYADFEYSFDKTYAKAIGVDVDALIIIYPETMEDGYNMLIDMISSGEFGLAVIDSHTAMVPKDRLEGEVGDAKMAPEARINSQGLKVLKPLLEKHQCTLLGISQLRAAIGKMGGGNEPTGGNAWKFYSDMRIKIWKKNDAAHEANETDITIHKNKCGKPLGNTKISIAWGIGIDKVAEIIDLASQLKVLKKSGSWYGYNGSNIAQGIDQLKLFFQDNPEVYGEIKEQTITLFKDAAMELIEIPMSEEAPAPELEPATTE